MTDTEFLTSPQVGLILGCSTRTIQRMATDGRLKYTTKMPGPNGMYLFKPEDIKTPAA